MWQGRNRVNSWSDAELHITEFRCSVVVLGRRSYNTPQGDGFVDWIKVHCQCLLLLPHLCHTFTHVVIH